MTRTQPVQSEGSTMSPFISVNNVTVNYGDNTALNDVSMELEGGNVYGLIGMNGSGKSTLFKTLTGQLVPSKGSVVIHPAPKSKNPTVAYMPQTEDIDWTFPLSVREVVLQGRYGTMGALKRPSTQDHRVVEDALERTGLTELRDRPIGNLSGGQKKRAFMARMLVQQAPIMLLDEPFAGVDTTSERMISDLLEQLAHEGALILVSLHDLHSVPEIADEVIVLNRTVVAQGSPDEMMTEQNLLAAFGSSSTSQDDRWAMEREGDKNA